MRKTLQYLTQIHESGVIGKYAIGGAMGAAFYIDPISTFDLDVFVVLPTAPGNLLVTLAPLYDHLRAAGFKEDKECVFIEGVPVQFLPAYNPLVEEALENALEKDYDGFKTPVFSAEHLAVIALQTGRGKDFMRIHAFVDSGVLDSAKLSDIVSRHGLEAKWKALMKIQP